MPKRGSLALAIACLVSPLAAQGASPPAGASRECKTPAPDSLWLQGGPVYRDCDVDKPAKRKGGEPGLDFDRLRVVTELSCLRVKLVFVVDTAGQPELFTVRTASSDHPQLELAVRATVERLRYTPARLGDHPVRQTAAYERSVATPQRVAFTVQPGHGPGDFHPSGPRSAPPKC